MSLKNDSKDIGSGDETEDTGGEQQQPAMDGTAAVASSFLARDEDEAEEDMTTTTPTPPPGAWAELSRSERKRDGEKKRRSDVNNGLDRLMELIFIIDPQLKAEAEHRAARNQAGGGIGGSAHHHKKGTADHQQLLSRVELIAAGVANLERLHRENEERKMVISHLSRGLLLAEASSSGECKESKDDDAAAKEATREAIPPELAAALSNVPDAQKRQELQEQLIQQSLKDSAIGTPQGLGPSPHGATAAFARPPLSLLDAAAPNHGLGLSRNPMAPSLSASALQSQGLPERLALLRSRDGLPGPPVGGSSAAPWAARPSLSTAPPPSLAALQAQQQAAAGLGADATGLSLLRDHEHRVAAEAEKSAMYRALLDRKLKEEEEEAKAAAALSAPPGSLINNHRHLINVAGVNPALLSRSSDILPSRIPGDSIHQALLREQTAAAAAAAAASRASMGGVAAGERRVVPASKRMKSRHNSFPLERM